MDGHRIDLSHYIGMQLETAKRTLGEGGALAEQACERAREAVQMHSLRHEEPIRRVWPYLRRATVRACYGVLRDRYRAEALCHGAVSRFVIAEASDPARAAMLADLFLTSDRIIRQVFGSPHSDIFRLRYLDGLTLAEISARLAMPLSTVKKHHRRIITKLRRALR